MVMINNEVYSGLNAESSTLWNTRAASKVNIEGIVSFCEEFKAVYLYLTEDKKVAPLMPVD